MSIPYLFGLWILAATLVLGQEHVPAPNSVSTAQVDRKEDAALEKAIRERFARSKISTNNFAVSVNHGIATITGRADVAQHKGTATRLARAAGATEIRNNIELTERARQDMGRQTRKAPRRVHVRFVENREQWTEDSNHKDTKTQRR